MVAIQDLYNQHKTSEEEKENQSINVPTAYEGAKEMRKMYLMFFNRHI